MPTASAAGAPASAPSRNQRACPALSTSLKAADCGAKRGSQIACPSSCLFNPFGASAGPLWTQVYNSWTNKAVEFVARARGQEFFADAIRRFELFDDDAEMVTQVAFFSTLSAALFVERDREGKTLADRWEAEAWRGLNNDERVMMRYRREGRPSVIEVKEVHPDGRLLCRDLLEPSAAGFWVLPDPILGPVTPPCRLFSWLVQYPLGCRLGGAIIRIGDGVWAAWREETARRHAEAAKTRPELGLKDYLAANLGPTCKLIRDLVLRSKEEEMVKRDLYLAQAVYRLRVAGSELQPRLEGRPDFKVTASEAVSGDAVPLAQYHWLVQGESAALLESPEPSGGAAAIDSSLRGIVAVIALYPTHLTVETIGKRKLAFARENLERDHAGAVEFVEESVRDLASYLREREKRERLFGRAMDGRGEHPRG